MGTTFVTLTKGASGEEPGFWMRDTVLELWLRLLALHLPDPDDHSVRATVFKIRNQWLLASRGWFSGFVPHGLEDACGTEVGKAAVRQSVNSLLKVLDQADTDMEADTLNLLGIEGGTFVGGMERQSLREVGYAFLDLLDGRIHCVAASTEVMPGTKPYKRSADGD